MIIANPAFAQALPCHRGAPGMFFFFFEGAELGGVCGGFSMRRYLEDHPT